MSDKSAIEWTDATWSPITGCTKVSPGCANCYLPRTPAFRMTGQRFVKGKIPVLLHRERLDQPIRWQKPRRVFVVSMGDLWHEDVPDWWIMQVFQVMAVAKQHTFQVLTKRPERMRSLLSYWSERVRAAKAKDLYLFDQWPLPNVWLGVSVENQRMAEERIPLLLETPAAVRFLSCEPLLAGLDLTPCLSEPKGKTTLRSYYQGPGGSFKMPPADVKPPPFIDWVIVGGESGGPEKRWMKMEWLESLVDQTRAAGVPLFVKQDSGKLPGRWGRIPEHLRIREFPDAVQRPGEVAVGGTRAKAALA